MRLPRPQGIRARLLASLLLALGGLVGIVATAWYAAIRPALRHGVATTQAEIARRAADHINDFLEQRIGELRAAAEIGRFWEAHPGRQREALYRLLKLAPRVSEVAVFDRQGRGVLRLSRSRIFTEADPGAAREAPWLQAAMRGEVYLGEVSHDKASEPFMIVAVPLKFTATEVRGALAAEVSLKALWNSIAHIRVGTSTIRRSCSARAWFTSMK
jgi:hypothetical protein